MNPRVCARGHIVTAVDGGGYCLECKRLLNREDYHRNREKRLASVNAYNAAHRDEKRAYSKEYLIPEERKVARRIYKTARYLHDPIYRAEHRIRAQNLRVRNLLGTKKEKHTFEEVGYSPEDYYCHMVTTLPPGLLYEECEHDHIIPVAFLLANGITSIRIVNALANFQLLSREANAKKRDRVDLSLAKGVVLAALVERMLICG